MLKRLWTIVLITTICLSVLPLAAQDRELEREKSNQPNEKRIALVIGNGEYISARKLTNSVNDATDMAKTLTELGFEVINGTNLNLKQMTDKVREFGDKLRVSGGVGLFYYAGHGIQANNKNYLIPVEADIAREDEIDYAALNFDQVLRKMDTANNGLNIVILDACRNNPFARSGSRDASDGGLAQITAPVGTFIAYATSPDKTASDGTGRNGLYTAELLKYIKQPNIKIEEAFKQVTIAVDRTSDGKQVPWTSSSLRGEFYFKPVKSNVVANPLPKEITEPTIVAKDKVAQEREAWDLVKNSSSASDFRYYLEEFPDGANAAKAKIRLEELVWLTVRGSDKTKIQAYLNEFPNGANASAARIRLKQLEAAGTPTNTTSGNTTANPTAGAITKATLPGGVEMSFAYIPAGSFEMGSTLSDNEKPVHTVKISQGFWMQQTEVTQAQWKAVMGALPSKCDYGSLSGNFLGDNKPIICVSWDDAQEFVRQMNLKNDGYKYHLPTEAEWEYAARAGTTRNYAGYLDGMAWYNENSGGSTQYLAPEQANKKTLKVTNLSESSTQNVATKQANAWGLYDMHGNVWEWCRDWYDAGYYAKSPASDPVKRRFTPSTMIVEGHYAKTPASDPVPAGGWNLVKRGGSWLDNADSLRSAYRDGDTRSKRLDNLGFRLLRK